MSKLLEQINREVEQKELIELGSLMSQITSHVNKIQKSNYLKNGLVPIYDQGNNDISGYSNDVKNAYNGKFPVVIFGDHTLKLRKIVSPFYLGADGNQLIEPIDDNLLDRNYFYYLLLAKKPKSYGYERHFKYLKEISIKLPNFPTQKKIAEILSAYDSKIENNNKIIKNLEATAQTIFNEWFINFHFPGYEKVKMIKNEMGEIPEGWEVKKLEEVFDVSIGRTPPRQEHRWFSRNPKDVKWVSIKDMGTSGIYIHNTDEYLIKEAVNKFSIPLIPKDTLIVSFKLTIGRLAITTEEMLSNEAIAHFKNKLNLISVEYAYLFLKKYNFDSLGSTSSIANAVNSKSIKSIQILVPEKKVMQNFEKIIKPLFQKILLIQEENISLKSQRDRLLAKLI